MESEASDSVAIPRAVGMLRDVPRLHEDILRHMVTFLDFQSIRQFRLVCHEWNAACLPILMKRGYYNLTQRRHGRDECAELYRGAKHYSSWKISHSVYKSSEILHDNGMWQNVKSLAIHQQTPLSREFHSWAWETIQTRCPNLQELTVIFEPTPNSQPERKVCKDYMRATMGKPNASFPKISNLGNLASIKFKGIYNKTTAYFAEYLLQACTNLRHLHFCQIGQPINVQPDVEAFKIFKYLKRNPSLLKNLQSFGFTIGFYSADENEDEQPVLCRMLSNQLKFTKFIQRKNYSSLQFNSDTLTKFFWDSPFHKNGVLLRGVLTPSIAASLLQLCLYGKVINLDNRADIGVDSVKISFPDFPRLRALKLGYFAARSLSVPKLVDCAPNLSVLELKQEKEVGPWGNRNEMRSLWRASGKRLVSNPKQQHLQLRIFCTDIPFHGLSTLGMILSKFPNLEELRLGRVKKVDPDPFLDILKSCHSKLQRLSWTLVKGAEMFTLDELICHLIRVPELLPTLNNYSLGHDEDLFHNDEWEDDSIVQEGVHKSAKLLLNLLPNSNNNSCLRCILLLVKCLNCDCKPTAEGESDRNDCRKCFLHQFIRRHNLPIRIPSEREMKEMKKKYNWDHRFASCWIYK
jgi:hypothetical protein